MRSFFSCLALIFLSFACTSAPTPEPGAASLAETSAPVSGPNCADEGFCTREYLPTSCQFNGQRFDGSNPCEAKKLAKRFACEKSLPFADASVQCSPKSEKPVAVGKECGQRVFCTKEMNPHSCVFSGEKFRGNNRCETIQKVRAFACERGLALDENAVVCEPVKSKKEKAG